MVFTHRPLFDLKPEWEWFTSDGDDVMNVLAPYENVTVLYGTSTATTSTRKGMPITMQRGR